MNIFKGFSIIIFIVGIVFLTVYFMSMSEVSKCEQKVIYKYLPRIQVVLLGGDE